MTANRYASTAAAAYLHQRFGFEFTGRPEVAALEDVIWEMARQAQHARQTAREVAQRLIEDAGYAIKSMDNGNRPDIYEVPERANLHDLITAANSRDRDLRQWITALDGTDKAYGYVRQHADRYLQERNEARQELAAVRNRLSVLAQQRIELEQKLMGNAELIGELERERDNARAEVATDVRARLAKQGDTITALQGELERVNAKRAESVNALQALADERDEALAKAQEQRDRADELERRVRHLEAG